MTAKKNKKAQTPERILYQYNPLRMIVVCLLAITIAAGIALYYWDSLRPFSVVWIFICLFFIFQLLVNTPIITIRTAPNGELDYSYHSLVFHIHRVFSPRDVISMGPRQTFSWRGHRSERYVIELEHGVLTITPVYSEQNKELGQFCSHLHQLKSAAEDEEQEENDDDGEDEYEA